MESFYVLPQYISGSELSIQGDEYHHLTRVLRSKAGDRILVVDGTGTGYECVIDRINREKAYCKIENVCSQYNEPEVDVTLMLPALKNHSRVEWIVEKGTELGIRRFLPVHTERTIRHRIRYDRLRKIARAAMKQSQRSFLPEIADELTLHELFAKADTAFDKIFIGHEGAPVSDSMRNVYGQLAGQRVLLLAGPEGGFTVEEVKICERNGGRVVSLGTRRYRAETAALIMAVHIIHD